MVSTTAHERQIDNRPRLTPASLFFVLLLFWALTQVELVLVLGLLALLFGTILERPVQFFQERRFPRAVAILAVYVIIIGSLVLLVVAVAPMVADQASQFSEDAPEQLRELQADWRTSSNPILSGPGDQLLARAITTFEGDGQVSLSGDTVDRAIPVVTSITGGVVATVTLLVMTFYYLLEKRLLRNLILESLSSRYQQRVDRLWTEVETKVGGWMRGQLLLCLIIGTIATTAYGIIDLEFWPLLGLWAGLTEIIPIIGPWIGGIPAVLIALTMSWELALITMAIIVGMQSLENWVLVPRVMKGAVGLTPLTVFVAILAGTQLMGIVGAVLAIPIAATIQVILTDFLDRRRDRDEHMSPRAGWRWMLARSGLREKPENGHDQSGDASDLEPISEETDDESFVAQHESESFTVRTRAPSEPDDAHRDADEANQTDVERPESTPPTAEGEDSRATQPARRDDRAYPAHRGADVQRARPTPDDDESPAFAAWPRATERDSPKTPSSTWPRPEEGRPDRRRKRSRRDD